MASAINTSSKASVSIGRIKGPASVYTFIIVFMVEEFAPLTAERPFIRHRPQKGSTEG
jgi:hypothetical protein